MLILLNFTSIHNYADSFFENDKLPTFQLINKDDGLGDLSVSNIIQDNAGYVWFATQGGLYKYDGRGSKSYRNNPFDTEGLIHNLIQTMYYDVDKNDLWLGTYQGISILDLDSNSFENLTVEDHGISNNVIVAIEKDTNGHMWFGTLDGLNRYEPDTGILENYEVEGAVVRSILRDSQDRLLVGTYEGLFLFDYDQQELVKIDVELPSSFVMSVKEFEPGVLSLGLWSGGLIELDSEFNVLRHLNFADNRVYTINKSRDKTLWIGTWGGGLFTEKNGKILNFPGTNKAGDIGHTIVYSLFEDHSGIMWIGTNGGGVYKINPRKDGFLEFTNDSSKENSIDAGKINTLYRDRFNRLWIAIYNKGLNLSKSNEEGIIKFNTNSPTRKLPDDQVMDMIEFNDALLIASGIGIDLYNEEQGIFIPTGIFEEDQIVYSLAQDSKNRLWVGTYTNGVYLFDKAFNQIKHMSTKNMDYPLPDDLIYKLLVDSIGRVWIATNNGLCVYTEETDTLKTYHRIAKDRTSLASNTIRSLMEDSAGQIWISMVGGGLAKYNEASDSFTSYTELDGLIDNTVVSIIEASDNRLWIATHNGLSVLDKSTDAIINLTKSDGISDDLFTGNGLLDTNGDIYFGGTNGVIRIPNHSKLTTTIMPPVYITDFSVLNEPNTSNSDNFNGSSFDLRPNENNVGFTFVAIDYENLSQLQYSYKLEGFNQDWIESGHRNYADYSNLSSGKYKFFVRVKTLQGEYTEPVSMSFTIGKPWYYTIYAYILYLLVISFIVYSVSKIRENAIISNKNQELADLNLKLEDANTALEQVSIKDPLTGAFNRRYLNTVLKDYIQLAHRSNSFLTVLMIDLDNFKQVNDTFGHIAGDKVLISLTRSIEQEMHRSTDFVARFGGDEFAVILYDTNTEGTKQVVDRLLHMTNALSFHNELDGTSIKINISIGVYSSPPEHDYTAEYLISKADEALYVAKHNGKMQAIFYKDLPNAE